MGIWLASDPSAHCGEPLHHLGISKMGANCWDRFIMALGALGMWPNSSQSEATQSDWSLLTKNWLANSRNTLDFWNVSRIAFGSIFCFRGMMVRDGFRARTTWAYCLALDFVTSDRSRARGVWTRPCVGLRPSEKSSTPGREREGGSSGPSDSGWESQTPHRDRASIGLWGAISAPDVTIWLSIKLK